MLKKLALLSSMCMLMSFGSTSYHGNYVSDWRIDQLRQNTVEGEVTKQDVLAQLGLPSFVSLDNQDIWYYASYTIKRLAIFKKCASRRVLELSFEDDKLVNINIPVNIGQLSKNQLRASRYKEVDADSNISNDITGNIQEINDEQDDIIEATDEISLDSITDK